MSHRDRVIDKGIEYINNGPFDEHTRKVLIEASKGRKSPAHPRASVDLRPMEMPIRKERTGQEDAGTVFHGAWEGTSGIAGTL